MSEIIGFKFARSKFSLLMRAVFYLITLLLSFFLTCFIMALMEIDVHYQSMVMYFFFPMNLLAYLFSLGFLFFNSMRKSFVLFVLPGSLCFLFWGFGSTVYNYWVSGQPDFKNFVILALPHFLALLILTLPWKFFIKSQDVGN
jgi:hypothetical protein